MLSKHRCSCPPLPLRIPIREQLVEVDCGGQTRLSLLTYPGPAQPGAFIRIYFSSVAPLAPSCCVLRYAALRYAWPDWRRAAPKRSQPTGPPFPTEQVKLVNQLSPLTRFSRAF